MSSILSTTSALIATLLLAAASPQRPASEVARAVVLAAERAVEGGGVTAALSQWSARLARDGGDRAAILALATLARLTYDDSTAERLYTRLHATDPQPADAVSAWAHIGHAQLLERQGRRGDVIVQLRAASDAARPIGDSAARAATLLEVSFARANTVGVPAGFAALDSAGPLIPAGADDLRAHFYRRRTVFFAVTGNRAARATADTALQWARRTGSAGIEGICLAALAQVYDLAGQNDSAVVTYAASEVLLRRARNRDRLATSMVRRANVLRSLGRLGEARAVLGAGGLEARAAHDGAMTGGVLVGLGALALQLGDMPAAAVHLGDARAHFGALGDSANIVIVHHFLTSVALATRDYDDARRYLKPALDWNRRIGEQTGVFSSLRLQLTIERRTGDFVAAERSLAEMRTMARAQSQSGWLHSVDGDEARLRLQRGDLAAAERLFLRYVASADSAAQLQLYDARMRLAEVYARRGQLDRTLREATSASTLLDRWRAGLTDPETRLLAFQATASGREEERSGVAYVLHALATGGRTADAFALAEQRRGRELADRLQQAAALRERPADASSAARRPALVADAPGSLLALRTALPDDSTALLEYVVGTGDAPTTLFVLTRAGIAAHSLPAADTLRDVVARFVSLLESGTHARPVARQLGAALLEPALGVLPPAVHRLLIVADGELHRVPFDALLMRDGRYVVERYAVSAVPSAAVFALLRARAATRTERGRVRLVAFGDPLFADEVTAQNDGAAAANLFRSAFAAAGGLPRLTESGREARLVSRYADSSVVRLRSGASASYLLHAPLETFDVVHLATHAIVDERSLARTALALSPGAGDDGFVVPGELAALHFGGALVILSACRTAGGMIVGGEGVQGLTAPLLEAGARSVVATGWRVGDRSALVMVRGIYDALARGLTIGDAVRAAKLAAIERGDSPGEWAAFGVIGDPMHRVPLRAPPPALMPWLIAAGVVLAAGTLVYGVWSVLHRARVTSARP